MPSIIKLKTNLRCFFCFVNTMLLLIINIIFSSLRFEVHPNLYSMQVFFFFFSFFSLIILLLHLLFLCILFILKFLSQKFHDVMCLHFFLLLVYIRFHFVISLYFIIGATFNEFIVLFFIANFLHCFFFAFFFTKKIVLFCV